MAAADRIEFNETGETVLWLGRETTRRIFEAVGGIPTRGRQNARYAQELGACYSRLTAQEPTTEDGVVVRLNDGEIQTGICLADGVWELDGGEDFDEEAPDTDGEVSGSDPDDEKQDEKQDR